MSEVPRKPSQSTRDYDASFEPLLDSDEAVRCLKFTRKLFSAWPVAEKCQVSKLATFGDSAPPH